MCEAYAGLCPTVNRRSLLEARRPVYPGRMITGANQRPSWKRLASEWIGFDW
jgi:hypothetical protein